MSEVPDWFPDPKDYESPPEPPLPPPDIDGWDEAVGEFEGHDGEVKARDRVEWVYEHLHDREPPKSGPSRGALGQLRWARKNQDQFYTLWRSVCLTKSEMEKDGSEQRKRTNRDLRARLKELIKK